MTAASLRRWPLSRTGHCVIDPLVPWASISSSSARPSLFQLQQSAQITRSYHQHRCHQYSSRTHIQRSPYIFSTTPKPASNTTIITPPHTRTMSSDNDYMSFLNKANADLNASQFQPQRDNTSSTPRIQTIHTNVRVPTPLTSVDAFYVSETDEPFEPVALKWPDAERGIWPDAAALSNLVSPDADLSNSIETLTFSTFDPKNQYAGVVRAVRAAVGDEEGAAVKVYRVEVARSRVEYFVLALDGTEGLVVGLRAKAIET
ncbi:uncharacterized protein BO87DRAFT_414695 [Aspergillus neoniger CBS 115656]|uniref:Uncharacterized protein n=1 Tax=Aspergillus neoniger (strain CBS 115656) TaxID=1448310 RepID=A0A318YTL1_ASPNB|nr:hypothetical protein BO87DRAFT_414695 [Aspergillus neoniger CBS 115656]PYH36153.1 hypothetical protein BO87DRAFT_414695 [Aspergillus neoniger CBS 115656]